MKNLTAFFGLITALVLASCSSTSGVTAYEDDIYYSPTKDKVVSEGQSEFSEEVDVAQKANEGDAYYDEDYAKGRRVEQNWDGASGRRGNYYNEDDFFYASRIRRFHRRGYSSFGYYDPYFTSYWYGSPSFYRPSFWQPGYYSNGWGQNSFFMNNMVWGAGPGWATSWPYNGFAYNPYSYWGNGFNNPYFNSCPSYGWAGTSYYSDAANGNVFTGQYTGVGGYAGSGSTSIFSRTKELPVTRTDNTAPTETTRRTNSTARDTEYVRQRETSTRTRTTTTRTRTRTNNTNRTYSSPQRDTYSAPPRRTYSSPRSSGGTYNRNSGTRSNSSSRSTNSRSRDRK